MIKIFDVEQKEKIIKSEKFPDGTKKIEQKPTEFAEITWLYETDDELATLIFLAKHLRDTGCKTMRLFMPYVPNGRYDRVKNSKEVFTLKHFAETINFLNFDEVIVLDPHSHVSEALFDRLIVLNPKDIIDKVIGEIEKDDTELILFFPDAGACKRYSDMFPRYKYTYGNKTRNWETGKISKLEIVNPFNIDLKDKTILMIDDIISYGGSMKYSAARLKELGVGKIYAYATHTENSVLDKEKGTLIKSIENGTVEKLFTTDSIFTGKHGKIVAYRLDD